MQFKHCSNYRLHQSINQSINQSIIPNPGGMLATMACISLLLRFLALRMISWLSSAPTFIRSHSLSPAPAPASARTNKARVFLVQFKPPTYLYYKLPESEMLALQCYLIPMT
jgi:hypothetical protein